MYDVLKQFPHLSTSREQNVSLGKGSKLIKNRDLTSLVQWRLQVFV